MAPNLQKAARTLLTPKEYSDLDGSEWEKLPPATRNQIRQSLPEPARQTFDAESRLRNEFGRTGARYEDFERAAVLAGPSKEPQARKTPEGRWSVDPSGALVRYFPNGFRTTRVQVLAPERFTVERDRQGRIIAIADARGNRTEATYDDTIHAPALPSPSRLAAYAFKNVRFVRPASSGQGKPEIFEVRDTKPPSADDVANLEDQDHWNDGLNTVTRGSEADRMEWMIDNQERQNRALGYGITVIEHLPGSSSEDLDYDPTAGVGVPARTGSQRVGLSSRTP